MRSGIRMRVCKTLMTVNLRIIHLELTLRIMRSVISFQIATSCFISRKIKSVNCWVYTGLIILGLSLANDQLDAQNFNTSITILYVYMFRAISCSSPGGQIVLINTASGTVTLSKWLFIAQVEKELFFLILCTERSLTERDDTRCCIN
jgi:hypothetical protein